MVRKVGQGNEDEAEGLLKMIMGDKAERMLSKIQFTPRHRGSGVSGSNEKVVSRASCVRGVDGK